MDRQQIGLKLAMDALELPFSLETFDDRLILQKAVSIVQSAGVDLGYHFHWYHRGPYSPGLTRDAFAIASEIDEANTEISTWQLDAPSKSRLEQLRGLFDAKNRCSLASKLELVGSILYLLRQGKVAVENCTELRKTLRVFGKNFSEADIKSGLKELSDYGLWGNVAKA